MKSIEIGAAASNSEPESLFRILAQHWHRATARYRPERHYMRGPGPKWREKHAGTVIGDPSAAQ